MTVFGGSHGLLSTAEDYLRFARMLLNNGELDGKRYLSRKTIELMTVNHVGDMRGHGQGFGLGFGIITDVAASGHARFGRAVFLERCVFPLLFHRSEGGHDLHTHVATVSLL